MTDIHAVRIITYGPSQNADAGKEWVAWLVLPSGRLPIAFFAPTEAKAQSEAQALWDSEAPARERNHQHRVEAEAKKAATAARKAAKAAKEAA
tara:strand:- start:35305 stop:35583 length:279 start_codon:yes stop_codon:yes gene_type:complete